MDKLQPFHLAIPVKELTETRTFYTQTLNCREGRSTDKWVDLDLYGHQLVLHIVDQNDDTTIKKNNPVDGHNVPVPHFGVVLTMKDWKDLAKRLTNLNIEFIIDPYIRFKGEIGEQATLFFKDPSGNALEFKAFKNMDQLFAK
ncbi:VOC family protein [Membranihabitans maritimus]|uniref:VOC family protein n=1 Tax=Membranihabitans maritimus TaxID=2904244 RepID=UPI001F3BF33A|nr:VOC family protein [Membranihabitans maritimus]